MQSKLTSTFGHGHNGQAAVPLGIHGPHGKDYIVLRYRQGRSRHIADGLHVLPVGGRRVAPQYFITGRQPARGRLPRYSGIVLQLLRQEAYIRRRRRGRGQRRQRCRVQTRHVCRVVVIHELRQIAVLNAVLGAYVLVLVVIVLAKFREPDGSESLLIEGKMIAAAQVAIAPEHHERLKRRGRQILLRHGRDIAGQLPRRTIVVAPERADGLKLFVVGGGGNAFREYAHHVRVLRRITGSAITAHDVVV